MRGTCNGSPKNPKISHLLDGHSTHVVLSQCPWPSRLGRTSVPHGTFSHGVIYNLLASLVRGRVSGPMFFGVWYTRHIQSPIFLGAPLHSVLPKVVQWASQVQLFFFLVRVFGAKDQRPLLRLPMVFEAQKQTVVAVGVCSKSSMNSP